MDLHNLTQVVEQAYHQVQPVVQQVVTILLNEPAHLIVEGVLLIFVLVLLCKRSYVIPKAPNSALLSSSVRFLCYCRAFEANTPPKMHLVENYTPF